MIIFQLDAVRIQLSCSLTGAQEGIQHDGVSHDSTHYEAELIAQVLGVQEAVLVQVLQHLYPR